MTNDSGTYKIETAVFEMNFAFITQKSWVESDVVDGGRRLKECKKLKQCCGANAFSGLSPIEKKERKDWCKIKGCSKNKCPVKRKKNDRKLAGVGSLNPSQSVAQKGIFTETDFNEILKNYAVLQTVETGAVLDATKLNDVTECRANNYSVQEHGSATLTCEKWNKKSCDDRNDYLNIYPEEDDAGDFTYFEGRFLKLQPLPKECDKKWQSSCCSYWSGNIWCIPISQKIEYGALCDRIGCDQSKCSGN